MRERDGRRMVSRVKGRPALLKSLVRLQLRVNRFVRLRASSDDDRRWACAIGDALDAACRVAWARPSCPGLTQNARTTDNGEDLNAVRW